MKKLLTLGVLVAGVALFAGCMNKPATEIEDTTATTGIEDTTTTTTDEVVPAAEDTTATTGTVETSTETPTPTAE